MEIAIRRLSRQAVPEPLLRRLGDRLAKRYRSRLPAELSVVFVGEERMRALNRQHRGIDRATDVLSFDYGEVIICPVYARKHAARYGRGLSRALSLLFVHGTLHVAGFDHETSADRKKMMVAEKKLLGEPGLVERAYGSNDK